MIGHRRLLPVALAALTVGLACSPAPSGGPNAAGEGTQADATDARPDVTAKAVDDDPAGREATPDALVEQAVQAMSDDEAELALKLIDLALEKDATHREALLMKGGLLYGQAQERGARDRAASIPLYRDASAAMRALREAYPDLRPQERNLLVYALYDEARILASQDRAEEAVEVLREAVEVGLDVPVALDDGEFAGLADREDFRALRESLHRKAADRIRAEIAKFEPYAIDFELPTVAGETVTLEKLRGKSVTIVDIWGTWCPPCRMEIPHFIDLYEEYQDDGLEIIGVTYENTEDIDRAREEVVAFLEEEIAIPYPLVLTGGDFLSKVPEFQGFPTTLFLDAEGQVRLKLVGYHAKEDLETVVTTLMAGMPAGDAATAEAADAEPQVQPEP